jgi:hypothetical protein
VDITFKNLSVHLQKKLESKKGKKPEVPEKPEIIPEVRYVLFSSAANVFGPLGSIRRRNGSGYCSGPSIIKQK